jgi:FkbH-like protein
LKYLDLIREAKNIPQQERRPPLRIALLSDAATQQMVPLLKSLLARSGFSADVYEGAFDAIELEVFDPQSALYRFQPDVIVLLHSAQAFRTRFYTRQASGEEFLNEMKQKLEAISTAVRRNSSALVIHSNLALPYERHFGNFDHRVPASLYSVTKGLNEWITETARLQNWLIHDVEAVSAYVGAKTWFDERLWSHSKTFCSLEVLPAVAANLVDVILAARGKVVKCVILDLDNTLWGGVIGDDGLNGIRLNAHGEGEDFFRFQLYLRELKRRGVLLCVCTKNDLQVAVLPFREHPAMVLREDDITVFVANWANKPDNIKYIQNVLTVGFDSMVFLDDNPFERNLVREYLPQIIVPELPEDPADYIRAISELNLFETASFSATDLDRAALYSREAQRSAAAQGATSIEEFLASLEMRIEIARFSSFHLPRIAQLFLRSNQFNLRTQRHSLAECERMMNDIGGCIPLYASLSDRFGDHGLIGITVMQRRGETLFLSDWLMSCRVLSRGVEQYLMNRVVSTAADLGYHTVTAEYIPTEKNAMVHHFYEQFGFTQVTLNADGSAEYMLRLADYQPCSTHIAEQHASAGAGQLQ